VSSTSGACYQIRLVLRFCDNRKNTASVASGITQVERPNATTTSATFSWSAAKLDQASDKNRRTYASISVVTTKVVFPFCYDALTMFSYRKANHFIDAAKLLFKVSICLSSLNSLIII